MSVGVLVIEAGENSGTRVTARCALEQNGEICTGPGNVTTREQPVLTCLIKQGAKLTSCWEDVWEELPTQIRMGLEQDEGFASQATSEASFWRYRRRRPPRRACSACFARMKHCRWMRSSKSWNRR